MMARKYLIILNIINAVIFIFVLLVFSQLFKFYKIVENPDGKLVFFAVFYYLKNLFVYCLYFALFGIALGIGFVFASMFGFIPGFSRTFMINFIHGFFTHYLALWLPFPENQTPLIEDLPDLIAENFLNFLNNAYLFSFSIFYVIALIYFIRAIFQNDPKYSMIAIGFLILMLIVPLMVFGLNDMFLLFSIYIEELDELTDPLSSKFDDLPINNFFLFIASPVTLLAILSYIYLEVAFQINYADTVTKPSLERRDRLTRQLGVIRRESHLITANVDKIKEEAQKKREEISTEKEQIGKFFAKITERFSYVKEMIEKKRLEEEEKKLITAASKTRRLGSYTERLFREDPEAENTLTARSSAPKAKNLAFSTAFNFAFRVSLLILVSYIVIHPYWFFVYVFNMPPAITESLAMYSPETIIVLLVPLMLLFPVVAQIISYIKHRNLIIRLKQEGKIKEILASVGDYVKKEEVEEDIEQKPEEMPSTASQSA